MTSRGLNVFEVDWIIVPIHLPLHWALAVIDMRTHEGESFRLLLTSRMFLLTVPFAQCSALL